MKPNFINYSAHQLTHAVCRVMLMTISLLTCISVVHAQQERAVVSHKTITKLSDLPATGTDAKKSTVLGVNGVATTQTTFSCDDKKSYLFQGDGDAQTINSKTSVFEFNILLGKITEVKAQLIPSDLSPKDHTALNNVGYNSKDNYMWGYRRGTNQLVRVANNWTISTYAISGLDDDTPYNAGDIDDDGIMYLFYGSPGGSSPNSSTKIRRVNLATKALLSDITLSPVDNGRYIIDLGFNPIDGNLYGIDAKSGGGRLVRINLKSSPVGKVTELGNIGVGNESPYGAVYFDNVGTLFISQNVTGKIYSITKVAEGNFKATFLRDGPVTRDNDGARCSDYEVPVNISGKVLNDANGLLGTPANTVDGTPVNSLTANTFSVNLIKAGKVVATTKLTNGAYSFENLSINTSYTVVLSNYPGTVGANAPSTTLTNGVVNTGENIGTGAGNDGNPNGIIIVNVVRDDVDDVNFGVERIPTANNVTANSQPNPGGTNKVTVPTLNGSDPEDGVYNGTSKTNTIIIKSLPSNGMLYYNNNPVSDEQVITNYDPAKLTLDPNDGDITVTFTYAERDAAGKNSPPATVTIPFKNAPDLTPLIYARPSTVYKTTDITVVVDVLELLSIPTSGTVVVKVTKDSKVTLTFPPNATSINSKSVQNSYWTYTSDASYHILTTNRVVPAGDKLSFGFTGVLKPGSTSGSLTISTVIIGGSGGEVRVNNNTDADKIDYFQQ